MAVKYNIPEILKTGKTIECFFFDEYDKVKRHYFLLTHNAYFSNVLSAQFFDAQIMYPSVFDLTDKQLLFFKDNNAVKTVNILTKYKDIAIPLSKIKVVAIY